MKLSRKLDVVFGVRLRQVQHNVAQTDQRVQTATSRFLLSSASPAARLAEQGFGPIDGDREFDLFLRHATENKDFVRPLAKELTSRGVKVWYDDN